MLHLAARAQVLLALFPSLRGGQSAAALPCYFKPRFSLQCRGRRQTSTPRKRPALSTQARPSVEFAAASAL
jgi:hypothetical protein